MIQNFQEIINNIEKPLEYKKYKHEFRKKLLTHKPIIQDNSGEYRHYITPEGNRYPSVTSILSKTSSKDKEQGLRKWRERVGEEEADRILQSSIKIGNRLHESCENFLLSKEVQAKTQKDEIMYGPMFEWLEKNIQVVLGLEIPLYSDKYRISGTCDCIAIVDSKLTIIDFKNSKKWKHKNWIVDYRLQCVMYAMMMKDLYGLEFKEYKILMAVQNGSFLTFEGECDTYRKEVLKRIIQYWK